jgi:hypothetical protein
MEDVLRLYQEPYDPDYPQVCLDETSKQLIGEVCAPLPCQPGQPYRYESHYVREGFASCSCGTSRWAAGGTWWCVTTRERWTGRR